MVKPPGKIPQQKSTAGMSAELNNTKQQLASLKSKNQSLLSQIENMKKQKGNSGNSSKKDNIQGDLKTFYMEMTAGKHDIVLPTEVPVDVACSTLFGGFTNTAEQSPAIMFEFSTDPEKFLTITSEVGSTDISDTQGEMYRSTDFDVRQAGDGTRIYPYFEMGTGASSVRPTLVEDPGSYVLTDDNRLVAGYSYRFPPCEITVPGASATNFTVNLQDQASVTGLAGAEYVVGTTWNSIDTTNFGHSGTSNTSNIVFPDAVNYNAEGFRLYFTVTNTSVIGSVRSINLTWAVEGWVFTTISQHVVKAYKPKVKASFDALRKDAYLERDVGMWAWLKVNPSALYEGGFCLQAIVDPSVHIPSVPTVAYDVLKEQKRLMNRNALKEGGFGIWCPRKVQDWFFHEPGRYPKSNKIVFILNGQTVSAEARLAWDITFVLRKNYQVREGIWQLTKAPCGEEALQEYIQHVLQEGILVGPNDTHMQRIIAGAKRFAADPDVQAQFRKVGKAALKGGLKVGSIGLSMLPGGGLISPLLSVGSEMI